MLKTPGLFRSPCTSQVASLEDTDGLPRTGGGTSAGEDDAPQAVAGVLLAEGSGGAGEASSGGGSGRAGWAKAEQVLGQRMERVATAWLKEIDQVRLSVVFCTVTLSRSPVLWVLCAGSDSGSGSCSLLGGFGSLSLFGGGATVRGQD